MSSKDSLPPAAIDKLCVDDERHLLYSLSLSSAIQVGGYSKKGAVYRLGPAHWLGQIAEDGGRQRKGSWLDTRGHGFVEVPRGEACP